MTAEPRPVSFVAFLRGINLGGRRVKMERLRALFGEMGFEDVGTFLASGNVFFDAPAGDAAEKEERIEQALEDALGYPVATFVRRPGELEELVGRPEVEEARAEGFTPFVIFLRHEAGAEVRTALDSLAGPDDRFEIRGREVIWLRRGKLREAPFGTRVIERIFGEEGSTRRKLRTVERIVTKVGGSTSGRADPV